MTLQIISKGCGIGYFLEGLTMIKDLLPYAYCDIVALPGAQNPLFDQERQRFFSTDPGFVISSNHDDVTETTEV